MKRKLEDVVLKLPIRKVGNSLVVTIPKDIATLYGLSENSELELIPESKDQFVIKIYKK
ncbi:MAG: AbrB/MazE/SpoVT family DNA-binding domain-containing protein [Candidatus Methanoperedens sp.]|nr:AbrB/MazE/SpoVT family DNA-binding domain-containing protein [Candidatus Methanoperedens sp.]